jgi:DNA-binding MarR family transcriptional regulator
LAAATGLILAISFRVRRSRARTAIQDRERDISRVHMPPDAPLRANEVLALKMLIRSHPKAVEIQPIASRLGISYAAAEKLIDEMESMGMVDVLHGWYGPNSVILTKGGRDLCVDHGMDN